MIREGGWGFFNPGSDIYSAPFQQVTSDKNNYDLFKLGLKVLILNLFAYSNRFIALNLGRIWQYFGVDTGFKSR